MREAGLCKKQKQQKQEQEQEQKQEQRFGGMMGGVRRGLVLLGLLIAMAASDLRAVAQLATTTVQDTVYRADGTPAGGSVVVTWGAFTTVNGEAVAAGTAAATIGAGGALSIALAPNAGSVPMGSYYTAVFHLNDGTTTREYWAVPVTVAGGGPVKLAAISTQVLPASVAMQTVSKAYVDNAIAAAQLDVPFDATPYVLKDGDTMTGPLNLPADPVSPTQAADMHYVDANIAAVSSGLGGKVSLAPGATQVVLQPAGTQLETNHLNGSLNATPYVSGGGNNGIANALESPDCATGCELRVEPTYPGGELVTAGEMQQGVRVEDLRGGGRVETSMDPLWNGVSATMALNNTAVRSASSLASSSPHASVFDYPLQVQNSALAGGVNQFPQEVETPPYFKSTYGVEQLRGVYNTQGQHVQFGNEVNCYGVGDCLAGSQFITSEGGYRDAADEGTHPFDLTVTEDPATYGGTCASGCTTGSTVVTVTATADAGTQGDGRFLMDKNPADVIHTGVLIGGGTTFLGPANFSGTSFPVSVFLATAQSATSQAENVSPGTVTLAIATSGVTAGYATSTAALPAPSGVACVVDGVGGLPSFETANYSVVDATHVQLTLNKVHESGATIAVGGLCGYGLEQTVDTVGPVRQVFPVVGSPSATSVYYAAAVTGVVGTKGQTSAYLNDTFTVASIARSGNVVTVTMTANLADDVQGLSMTVSGVVDSSYNGTYTVTTTGPNTLTYANTGANSTSSGGTVSVLTGGYNLYPMAEVLSVYNPATKTVDGTMTLAPNTVAWAAGDSVEEPHYYQQRVAADAEFITQYVPRPTLRQNAGKYYGGVVGPYMVGWEISNLEAASDYIGGGGTHTAPTDAYSVQGVWSNDLEVTAGVSAVIRAHCNVRGCNRWDSGYSLFALDSATGADALNFSPQSDTAAWSLGGTAYSFSPAAFTAGTINVGTLNATTITGGVAGSAITSGTVSAARLPVFGPSGTSHAVGAVPDPGATAGSTRYLREDGTWVVPAVSGSGTVTSFAAPSASWPSWLTPTVTNATSTPSLAVALGSVAANTVFGNATGSSATPGFTSAPSVSSLATGTLSASNANFFVNSGSGCNLGLGTVTPNSWLGASSEPGCNLQMFSSTTASRLIIVGSATSEFHLVNTSAPVNSRAMRFSSSTAGVFTISSCSDSYACVAGFTMQPVTGATTLLTATVNQIVGGGASPTMAASAGAGISPSCTTIAGTNIAGVISCTTGTATVASATLASVTFNGALATAPQGCTLMARNAAAAGVVGTVYTTAPTVSGWSIAVGGTAVAASTAYSWSYSCL
jgi:hypothetical protein